MSETGGFDPHNGWHPYVFFDDEICDFSRIPTWTIFDANGLTGRLGPEADSGTMQMYTKGLPAECGAYGGWSEDNSKELELGWIKKGDTLEELVADMANPNAFVDDKMSVETLQASIDRWNEMCAAGADSDFGRDESTLEPISTPPYYAIANYPGGCTTLGGPLKNEHAQLLDQRRGYPEAVRRRLHQQLPGAYLWHLRWRQRREHGLGPHRRTPRLRAGALGQVVRTGLVLLL